MAKKENDFKFHVPVELTKSEEDGEWRIKGIASTPDQDLQGEIVEQEGLDISALKAGRGLFNWDHQKGPENVLGQIEGAQFINRDGKRVLEVDGYLFKDNDRSKGVYSIIKGIKKGKAPRVHMSIEGKILKRDFMNDKKINKARIDKVALTLDPVNPYTYADLVKSLANGEVCPQPQKVEKTEEMISLSKSDLKDVISYAISKAQNLHFEEGSYKENPKPELKVDANEREDVKITDHDKMADRMRKKHKNLQDEITKAVKEALLSKDVYEILKALAAGAPSQAPTARTGGEATQKESLEKDPKSTTYKEKKKKINKALIKSTIESLKKAYPKEDPWELAEMVIEAFMLRNVKESHSD